ncbi:MAG: hypothetical protein A2539_02150 [Elusimicrobia bacterium RIFOXYD2_FULL_34_15]|nr:MAG: hypothetical protein A2539_02150 [Elusimicrobia bacterium RIFOXYD2_FULL_34_15]
MGNILLKLITNIISFILVVYLAPGIKIDSLKTLIIAALILTLINTFLKPIILIFTLPFNIISLGLFTFIINGFIFYIISKIISGLSFTSFGNAVWCALIFSVISFFVNLFFGHNDNVKFNYYAGNKSWQRDTPCKKYEDVIDVEVKEEKSNGDEKKRISNG